MRVAIQVPIKGTESKRFPGKNLYEFRGKPLAFYLLDELKQLEKCDIYIDSESTNMLSFIDEKYPEIFQLHKRHKWLASDNANGNHLLNSFAQFYPNYDLYLQVFITAINLKANTIQSIIEFAIENKCNSLMAGTYQTGLFWYDFSPVNLIPDKLHGLPRTQDAQLFKESTGLYLITRGELMRTGTRYGSNPVQYKIPDLEAIDIDTMADIRLASALLPR